jgi:hypothetical protein
VDNIAKLQAGCCFCCCCCHCCCRPCLLHTCRACCSTASRETQLPTRP